MSTIVYKVVIQCSTKHAKQLVPMVFYQNQIWHLTIGILNLNMTYLMIHSLGINNPFWSNLWIKQTVWAHDKCTFDMHANMDRELQRKREENLDKYRIHWFKRVS